MHLTFFANLIIRTTFNYFKTLKKNKEKKFFSRWEIFCAFNTYHPIVRDVIAQCVPMSQTQLLKTFRV